MHGDEIIVGLFFDDSEKYDEYAHGWALHILAEGTNLEVWGDQVSLPEVIQMAYAAVEARAEPRGLTHEESREGLIWRPLRGRGVRRPSHE